MRLINIDNYNDIMLKLTIMIMIMIMMMIMITMTMMIIMIMIMIMVMVMIPVSKEWRDGALPGLANGIRNDREDIPKAKAVLGVLLLPPSPTYPLLPLLPIFCSASEFTYLLFSGIVVCCNLNKPAPTLF